jgi:hypothetical protein
MAVTLLLPDGNKKYLNRQLIGDRRWWENNIKTNRLTWERGEVSAESGWDALVGFCGNGDETLDYNAKECQSLSPSLRVDATVCRCFTVKWKQ